MLVKKVAPAKPSAAKNIAHNGLIVSAGSSLGDICGVFAMLMP